MLLSQNRWAPWLVAIGGLIGSLVALGDQASYGVWLIIYQNVRFTSVSLPVISAVGSLQIASTDLACLLAGILQDRLGPRLVAAGGLLLMVLSHIWIAFAEHFVEVYLAQGFLLGLGQAGLTIPANTLPLYWNSRRGAFVMGMQRFGVGIGGIIVPIIFHQIDERSGFVWANIALAFIFLGLGSVAVALLRPMPRQHDLALLDTGVRRWSNWRLVLQHDFLLFCAARTIARFSAIPFQQFLPDLALLGNRQLAPYMLSIFNGSYCIGALAGGFGSDLIGIVDSFALTSLLYNALAWGIWLPANTTSTILAVAILIGFLQGATFAAADAATNIWAKDLGIDPGVGMGFAIATHVVNICSGPLGALLVRDSAARPYLLPGVFWASFNTVGTVLAFVSALRHRHLLRLRESTPPATQAETAPHTAMDGDVEVKEVLDKSE